MRYLLDTCVVSDFARGHPQVLVRIKAASPDDIAVTTMTIMEVEYGLCLNETLERKLRPVIQAFFQSVLVLPYEEGDALASAAVRAALKKQGKPIGAYDILIVGCALSRGLILTNGASLIPQVFDFPRGCPFSTSSPGSISL